MSPLKFIASCLTSAHTASLGPVKTKPVTRKSKYPIRIWVVSFEFSAMSNQEGWRKIGNISLKSCSQMLKEIGRIENLVRTDKMCEIAGASPIYM